MHIVFIMLAKKFICTHTMLWENLTSTKYKLKQFHDYMNFKTGRNTDGWIDRWMHRYIALSASVILWFWGHSYPSPPESPD